MNCLIQALQMIEIDNSDHIVIVIECEWVCCR